MLDCSSLILHDIQLICSCTCMWFKIDFNSNYFQISLFYTCILASYYCKIMYPEQSLKFISSKYITCTVLDLSGSPLVLD